MYVYRFISFLIQVKKNCKGLIYRILWNNWAIAWVLSFLDCELNNYGFNSFLVHSRVRQKVLAPFCFVFNIRRYAQCSPSSQHTRIHPLRRRHRKSKIIWCKNISTNPSILLILIFSFRYVFSLIFISSIEIK